MRHHRVTHDLPGQSVMDAIVLAVDALLSARKRLASIDPDWDQGHLFPIALEALNAAPTVLRALFSSPASILPGNAFTPTHRHIEKGRDYEYIGGARIQSEVPLNDMDEVAVYLGRDGDLWARRQSEFNTSRFESLPEAPLPPEDPYIAELEAENSRLKDAVLNVLANRFDTYKARNGKQCSIEGEDGEKCWIVSFDDMSELEAAVCSDPATLTNGGTIPVTPMKGLETVGEVSTIRENVAAFAGHVLSNSMKPGDLLCLKSQAEAIIAANDAEWQGAAKIGSEVNRKLAQQVASLETQLTTAKETAARAAYRACAETRHVSLGHAAADAVRAALEVKS